MNTKIYYNDNNVLIRSMVESDIKIIYDTFSSYNWHPNIDTYNNYLKEQEENTRLVLIAEYNNEVSGLVTLIYHSSEGPDNLKDNYPEVDNLTVFYDKHNLGIGTILLDVLEKEAFKISKGIYLVVGANSNYGIAQRMYIKRGYNFDGSGLWYEGKQLDIDAPCNNNDDLLLFMVKEKK